MSIGGIGCATFLMLGYSIYGAIAFGFLGASGALGYFLTIRQEAKLKQSNPLIQALEAGNSDYLEWFYVTVLAHMITLDALSLVHIISMRTMKIGSFWIWDWNMRNNAMKLSLYSKQSFQKQKKIFLMISAQR